MDKILHEFIAVYTINSSGWFLKCNVGRIETMYQHQLTTNKTWIQIGLHKTTFMVTIKHNKQYLIYLNGICNRHKSRKYLLKTIHYYKLDSFCYNWFEMHWRVFPEVIDKTCQIKVLSIYQLLKSKLFMMLVQIQDGRTSTHQSIHK